MNTFKFSWTEKNIKGKIHTFYEQAKEEVLWTQHQIMQYIAFQKECVEKGVIKEFTINNFLFLNLQPKNWSILYFMENYL
ncbi:MAG: hypothetical protein ACE5SW_08995 [Nitrososphaeraceae archaeon]